mmetsp:Transcript_23505/g.43671  ORF Transcript_23505/g.43671 Transcript_23505/m.43671 type:complete len:279 (+) Transcript_23505:208-1044(+)
MEEIPSAYVRNLPASKGGPALLIVDPQADFHPGGSLAIPTANDDAERIASFIRSNIDKLQEIYVTLDTHSLLHIAHPLFWVNASGDQPEPFTVITLDDVKSGTWKASRSEFQEWSLTYLAELERQQRFVLTIWPPHCLLGTVGHSVVPAIGEALQEWEAANKSCVTYIYKGNNSLTENYSGLKAEVVRGNDPTTALNIPLVKQLRGHSEVISCGQARSHCVNFTVRDLADNWDAGRYNSLVILEDCCSDVTGFEKEGEKFIADMTAKGLKIAKSTLKL